MTIKQRLQSPIYRHLFIRFFDLYEEARGRDEAGDAAGAQLAAFDALEYAWKAISFVLGGTRSKVHFPDGEGKTSLLKALRKYSAADAEAFVVVLARHSRGTTNPTERVEPRYDRDAGDAATVRRLLSDLLDTVAPSLVRLNRSLRATHSVGRGFLLDGRLYRNDTPIPAPVSGLFQSAQVEDWRQLICLDGTRFAVESLAELGPLDVVAANPYGEIYPDRATRVAAPPGWNTIRRYVLAGGTWLHAGAWPFFYFWDPDHGGQRDAAILSSEFLVPIGGALGRAREIPRALTNQIPGAHVFASAGFASPCRVNVGSAAVSLWRPVLDVGHPAVTPLSDPIEVAGSRVLPGALIRYGFGAFVFLSACSTTASDAAAHRAFARSVISRLSEELSAQHSWRFQDPWGA